MGLKQFLIGFGILLIFTVAIINFATWFAIDNNAAISIADDSELTAIETDADSDASTYNLEVNKTSKAFQESEITDESETTRTGAVFKLRPKSVDTFINVLSAGYQKVFGGGSAFVIIFSTILGLVTLVFILVGWKAWKGGQVE